jgi:hypothetical protein
VFRVPREILTGSLIFEQIFTLPQTDIAYGISDERPLHLDGLSADEFRAFVSATIPRYVANTPTIVIRGAHISHSECM